MHFFWLACFRWIVNYQSKLCPFKSIFLSKCFKDVFSWILIFYSLIIMGLDTVFFVFFLIGIHWAWTYELSAFQHLEKFCHYLFRYCFCLQSFLSLQDFNYITYKLDFSPLHMSSMLYSALSVQFSAFHFHILMSSSSLFITCFHFNKYLILDIVLLSYKGCIWFIFVDSRLLLKFCPFSSILNFFNHPNLIALHLSQLI